MANPEDIAAQFLDKKKTAKTRRFIAVADKTLARINELKKRIGDTTTTELTETLLAIGFEVMEEQLDKTNPNIVQMPHNKKGVHALEQGDKPAI